MADAKKPLDLIVPVEGEPTDDVQVQTKSGLAEANGSGTKVTIAIVSLFSAIVVYLFMFSDGKKEDIVDNRAIVRQTGENAVSVQLDSRNANVESIGNLISVDYDNERDSQINEQLLELPTLPSLPENIRTNIEDEVREIKKQKENEEVFTKVEVDNMIDEKLKAFESEMKRVKDESERLAKEIQRQKLLEEEENKKAKKSVIPSILTTPDGSPPINPNANPLPSGNDPFAVIDSEVTAEQKRREEEEKTALQRAQRNRVLEERKSASMFKMQGGGGGDTVSVDQNSIIVLTKDSLDTVTDTVPSNTTTKVPDLSRTLVQGKIISAILETAINTDINNQIRAIVSRDVYSETNKNVLIPKGSKLIGSFQATGLNSGVSRITITWSRLIRIDGLNVSLSANTTDDLGRGGIDGELDNKYTQSIKNSLLSSIVTIASSLLVEKITGSVGISNATTSTSTDDTTVQTSGKVSDYAIIEAAENFTDEMKTLTENLRQQNPTIRVAQGTRLNVIVNQDMNLPIYKQK
jgi:type IV secretion system protein VirB10